MPRAMLVAALVAVALACLAGPASAGKDPFKPVVTVGTTTTSTTTQTTTTTQPAVVVPAQDVTTESMPNTGSDSSTWLVLAYLLVVAGAGALALERTLRPAL